MRCRRSRLIASALTALLAGPLFAQAPAPLAFVGVRIVDGSGNEPFAGTVVVEGGRIRAAGRTVETPAGATIVDGAGKSLLPGLVDVRALDEETRPADDWSRLLSRLLAAGITTAVVPRVPANATPCRASWPGSHRSSSDPWTRRRRRRSRRAGRSRWRPTLRRRRLQQVP
jgi:hypothetical protein